MNPKKIVCLAVLVFYLTFALGTNAAVASDTDKDNDGFRITIVVGGCVAAGVFWFVSYSSGFAGVDLSNRTALLNYGADGWQAGIPTPHLVEKGANAGDTYLELLTVKY